MKFEEAAEQVKKLKSRPPDDIFLKCYSLYKQATVGDINITKPKSSDFKEKAKFEAWGKMKGMKQETARDEYIKLAQELIAKYGINP